MRASGGEVLLKYQHAKGQCEGKTALIFELAPERHALVEGLRRSGGALRLRQNRCTAKRLGPAGAPLRHTGKGQHARELLAPFRQVAPISPEQPERASEPEPRLRVAF